MKIHPRITALLVGLALCSNANANDVARACAGAKFPVLVLTPGQKNANIDKIKKALGSEPAQAALLTMYTEDALASKEEDRQLAADQIIEKFVPPSKYKTLALKYSTEGKKLTNFKGYREALVSTIEELVPADLNNYPWFKELNDPMVVDALIRNGTTDDLGIDRGAVFRTIKINEGKFLLEIVISTGASESLPAMVPLMLHEIQHAKRFKKRIALLQDDLRLAEDAIIDEARGNELQLKAYLALAKKQPGLFCDWTYVSSKYEGLVMPLSWAMATFEAEIRAGTFLFDNYLVTSPFRRQLLNDDSTALRPDLQKKIKELNLTYFR